MGMSVKSVLNMFPGGALQQVHKSVRRRLALLYIMNLFCYKMLIFFLRKVGMVQNAHVSACHKPQCCTSRYQERERNCFNTKVEIISFDCFTISSWQLSFASFPHISCEWLGSLFPEHCTKQ